MATTASALRVAAIKVYRVRFVYLNPVGECGGAERSLLSWMEAARQSYPDAVFTLVVPGDGPLVRRARALNVDVELLPFPAGVAEMGDSGTRSRGGRKGVAGTAVAAIRWAPAALGVAADLRRILERQSCHLVHSNGIKTHLLLRLTRWSSTPIVWHLHDFWSGRPLASLMGRWASEQADAAIAVSEAVAIDARRALKLRSIQVVHNVVNPEQFAPGQDRSPGWLDRAAGLGEVPSGTLRVALVATYAKWKGHDVLLDAAELLVKTCPQVRMRFFVVGGPIYRTRGSQFSLEELRNRCAARGLAHHVGFIPFQEHPADVYRAADVVVHASTQPEPFGLTIVEAMACGRATIVSLGGGTTEIITPGKDAIGVPPCDVRKLADELLRLATDATLRERLGANARETVVKRFNSMHLPHHVKNVYAPLLRGGLGA